MAGMGRMGEEPSCPEPSDRHPAWQGQDYQGTAGREAPAPASRPVAPEEPPEGPEPQEGLVAGVELELKRWLTLAARLEDELAQPEPNPATIATLLAERSKLQERLLALIRDGPAEVWRREPRLRELAEAIVATDRATMERARALRAECLRQLAEIQKRREMAAGYRRTLQGAVGTGPLLYDKQV